MSKSNHSNAWSKRARDLADEVDADLNEPSRRADPKVLRQAVEHAQVPLVVRKVRVLIPTHDEKHISYHMSSHDHSSVWLTLETVYVLDT